VPRISPINEIATEATRCINVTLGIPLAAKPPPSTSPDVLPSQSSYIRRLVDTRGIYIAVYQSSDGFWDSLLREIPLLPPIDHTSWPKDSLHSILQLLPHTPTWRIHPPDSCPSVLGTCLGLACALTCSTCTRYLGVSGTSGTHQVHASPGALGISGTSGTHPRYLWDVWDAS
jgi:hypothetical protein